MGSLPSLSGFVDDVDRYVAQERIAIAGFAAARASELRDGPDAYEAERRAQASGWLSGSGSTARNASGREIVGFENVAVVRTDFVPDFATT